jgi:steroid 5-alpha reductase family enzyme
VIDAHYFLTGLAVTAAAEVVLFLATYLAAVALGRWNVVDVTWGASFVVVAAVSFAWSAQVPHADATRRILVLALTGLWGLRLSGYIAWRSRGHGEDPRYRAIMEKGSGSTQVRALTIIFGPQAFLSWFVSLPVQIAMYLRAPTGWLTGVGVAVWAVGIFFEAVGDAQMAAFRADPANRGQIMDRGLWRYTRHPNYFGDAAVWTGLFLIAAQRWPGVTTVASPFAMLYFLYFKSGKGLLEKSMAANRPGYREYMERTSGFFPLPPRRA